MVLDLPMATDVIAERLAFALLGADPRVRQLEDGRWAVVAEVQGSPLLEDCVFAVVDVETTGMGPRRGDRITELAVVIVHGARRELVLDCLINPGCPIPFRIAQLTGITDSMVCGAPTFEQMAERVLDALSGRIFVAHNARFDWSFVNAEVQRARDLALEGPRLCTVRLARRLLPQLESRSLDSLTHFFGLENGARHRAAGDALVTAEVLQRLIQLSREQGIRTLAELQTFATRKAGSFPPLA